MLRVRELLDAIELAHEAGERRYGHFDHDAHAATGPFPEPKAHQSGAASDVADVDAVKLTVTIDPITGEPLFTPST
jgi:hypothetical protein